MNLQQKPLRLDQTVLGQISKQYSFCQHPSPQEAQAAMYHAEENINLISHKKQYLPSKLEITFCPIQLKASLWVYCLTE